MVQLELVIVHQDSRQAVDSSVTQHVVQLEPVTAQQHSRQSVGGSVRNYSLSRQFRVYRSIRVKYLCTQFSQRLQKIQLHSSSPVNRYQLDPVNSSAIIIWYRYQLQSLKIILQQTEVISTQKQPGCKKRCSPVQNGQCKKL